MSLRRPALLSLICATALLAVAACGGGGGPTKAQYQSKANAICKTAKSQTAPLVAQIISAAGALATGSGSTAKVATLLERLHANALASLKKLRALEQPKGDHAAIVRFLGPLGTVVDAMDTAAKALRGGQALQALGTLQQVQPSVKKLTDAAGAYGLKNCSQLFAGLG